MAYDFAVDTEQMETLKTALGTAKTNISSESTGIPGIFKSIDGLSESWKGSSYTTFHDGAHAYDAALQTLPKVIEVFEKEIETLEGPAGETVTAIQGEVEKMKAE